MTIPICPFQFHLRGSYCWESPEAFDVWDHKRKERSQIPSAVNRAKKYQLDIFPLALVSRNERYCHWEYKHRCEKHRFHWSREQIYHHFYWRLYYPKLCCSDEIFSEWWLFPSKISQVRFYFHRKWEDYDEDHSVLELLQFFRLLLVSHIHFQ